MSTHPTREQLENLGKMVERDLLEGRIPDFVANQRILQIREGTAKMASIPPQAPLAVPSSPAAIDW
jgi:hypothetical protein